MNLEKTLASILPDLLDSEWRVVYKAGQKWLKTGRAESLHELRVALRTLHSQLRAYQPWFNPRKRIVRALRHLAHATGPLRDAEVRADLFAQLVIPG